MGIRGNRGLLTGGILAVVSASIDTAVAFGWTLTAGQRLSITALATTVTAVAPSVGALFDHSHRQAKTRIHAATLIAKGGNTVGSQPGSRIR